MKRRGFENARRNAWVTLRPASTEKDFDIYFYDDAERRRMINPSHNAQQLRSAYGANRPFPHIVIDDFLELDVASNDGFISQFAT